MLPHDTVQPTKYPSVTLKPFEACFGYIDTPQEALMIFEACRRGLLTTVRHRLTNTQKQEIRSGSIFVFIREKSNIIRWTDAFRWTPSRLLNNNFLIYRQISPKSTTESVSTEEEEDPPTTKESNTTPDRKEMQNSIDTHEPGFGASLKDEKMCLKKDGLVKKSTTMLLDGLTYHLISYYKKSDVSFLKKSVKLPPGFRVEIRDDLDFSRCVIGKDFTFDETGKLTCEKLMGGSFSDRGDLKSSTSARSRRSSIKKCEISDEYVSPSANAPHFSQLPSYSEGHDLLPRRHSSFIGTQNLVDESKYFDIPESPFLPSKRYLTEPLDEHADEVEAARASSVSNPHLKMTVDSESQSKKQKGLLLPKQLIHLQEGRMTNIEESEKSMSDAIANAMQDFVPSDQRFRHSSTSSSPSRSFVCSRKSAVGPSDAARRRHTLGARPIFTQGLQSLFSPTLSPSAIASMSLHGDGARRITEGVPSIKQVDHMLTSYPPQFSHASAPTPSSSAGDEMFDLAYQEYLSDSLPSPSYALPAIPPRNYIAESMKTSLPSSDMNKESPNATHMLLDRVLGQGLDMDQMDS